MQYESYAFYLTHAQWVDFRTNWSSSLNEETGTVSELTGQLEVIIEEERHSTSSGFAAGCCACAHPQAQDF